MNKKMEQMILQDLGMDVSTIRKSSWEKLDKVPYNRKERPFRPDMFSVTGNIHLIEGREMGMTMVKIHSFFRKVRYELKCLLKHKKSV